MFRASIRSSAQVARAVRQPAVAARVGGRRLASTSAASRGTWKGSAARWGVAIGALYWYNTSPIFADEAARPAPAAAAAAAAAATSAAATATSSTSAVVVPQDSELLTIDALLEEKQKQQADKTKEENKARQAERAKTAGAAAAAAAGDDKAASASSAPPPGEDGAAAAGSGSGGSPGALEEEASQQGAFNPETGEINWDCPCLGGMANGPCGEDFKAAFSCFVYSAEEPKGMDCIDKFQHMQDCFRQYPEIYGAELDDNEQDGAADPDALQHQQPPAVDGAAVEGAAAAAPEPVAELVQVNEEKQALAERTTAARIHDATAAPVPASSPAAPPAPSAAPAASAAPAKAVEDSVVQAEVGAPDQAGDKDGHLPTAAFDATAANKPAKN